MDQFFEIRSAIEPAITGYGYEIVRLKWIGADAGKTLQIMVEPADGGKTDIDTCGKISQDVSAIMDVEGFVADKYFLEVTSPGIDRPLTREKDFERFAGFETKIEAKLQIDGRKRFRGKLLGMAGVNVEIEDEGNVYKIEFDNINEAKLVLTDNLIKEIMKKTNNQ